MAMRLSGLMSGMDTESIVSQLVEARKTKVTKAVKAQKSLKYKQDAWKSLNTQIKKLYDGALSNLRFESSFIKKTTKVSNSSIVSVITGEGAMNSVQSLEVEKLAKSAYLTGGEISAQDGGKVTASTTLRQLGLTDDQMGDIEVTVAGETKTISVSGDTKISDFVKSLQNAGLNANFDETNQRFYIAAKSSGTENDFSIKAKDTSGLNVLSKLGISYSDETVKKSYQDIVDGRDASVASRVESTLKSLTAQRNEYLSKQNDLMTTLRKYKDQFADKGINVDGIDMSVLSAADFTYLNDVANEIIADAEAAVPADDADAKAAFEVLKADLTGWTDRWQDNETALAEVEGKLDIDVDGNVVGLNSAVEADITAKVDEEVAEAQKVLDEIDAAAAQTRAKKDSAADAKIWLNGVDYTSDKNSFEINGLTLTVNSTTAQGESVTITTQDDTDGIYDMIKGFLKEYNELINQMDKLYNADSAKGYEPLTDEEKDAMSDTEIEEWENKIKDSILRKDGTLNSFAGAMKEIMLSGVEVNGRKMYLAEFGIGTLSYFTAAENERNAYHIDGDSDDENTSGNADKLKSAIASDPQKVVDFFTGLSRQLYTKMTDLMAGNDYSSAYTAYEDKKMKSDYDDYTKKIKELEDELADYEDKWYAKFAAMETAMAKMQSNASAVTGLLGGS